MSIAPLPLFIKSPNSSVSLEAYSPQNQDELWDLILEDRKGPGRSGLWPDMPSIEVLRSYMNSCDFTNPSAEEYGYVIRDDQNKLVGTVHVHEVSWEESRCEVGFWLHHAFTGKGIVGNSVSEVEKALKKIGFIKFYIETNVWNSKACAVAVRGGYKLWKRFHKGMNCIGCDECSQVYVKEV